MNKVCAGLLAVLSIAVLSNGISDAGHRRSRRCCVPCAPACCSPVAAAPVGTFPDVCPQIPIYTNEEDEWVWTAERHYGEGLNCTNCYTESTSMTGDFGLDTYLWPYPCGDDMCEPSQNVRGRVVPNSGTKNPRYPVDMNFDPIREMPPATRARQFCPKSYYRFTDLSATPQEHFFIVYGIKTPRSQVRVGFEVPEDMLKQAGVSVHDVSGTVYPADMYGKADTGPSPDHSYVYLRKVQDSSADMIFFLKKQSTEKK